MLRTASNREFSTGVSALVVLSAVFGLLLALTGLAAATEPAAANPSVSAASVATGTSAEPSPAPSEGSSEAPVEEAPVEDAPPAEEGDDGAEVDDDEGFPLWAIILIVVLVLALALAIGYAATRDRRDRI